MPRGDGGKSGTRRTRKAGDLDTVYVPKGLASRVAAWSNMKDKRGYRKPGSQNPRKS